MINGLTDEKQIKKHAQKQPKTVNKNDSKNRIEQIHVGEKLAPITQKSNEIFEKRIRIYRNGDAFHKGINVRMFLLKILLELRLW